MKRDLAKNREGFKGCVGIIAYLFVYIDVLEQELVKCIEGEEKKLDGKLDDCLCIQLETRQILLETFENLILYNQGNKIH